MTFVDQQQQEHDAVNSTMEVAFDAFMAESQVSYNSSPVDYVTTIIPPDLSPDSFAEEIYSSCEGYTVEVVTAIRNNDIDTLRRLLAAGQSFHVCNSNGEYLIHLACRRSQPPTVEFIVSETDARPEVRDKQGRTILHDVCWKSTPDVAMMATVLRLAPPELLLAKDNRGHTPFDFARKQHSQQWNDFLKNNRDFIQERLFAYYFNKALVENAWDEPAEEGNFMDDYSMDTSA